MTQQKQEKTTKKKKQSTFLDVILNLDLAPVPLNSSSVFSATVYSSVILQYCEWRGEKITGGTSVSDQSWDYLLISECKPPELTAWEEVHLHLIYTVSLNACTFISIRRLFRPQIQQALLLVR